MRVYRMCMREGHPSLTHDVKRNVTLQRGVQMHVPVPNEWKEDNTMGADAKLIVLGERPGSGDPVLRAPNRGRRKRRYSSSQ